MSNFNEEVGMGNQWTNSDGHQSGMEPKEVFRTLKDIDVGNVKMLQYMEEPNQIN